MWSTNSIAQVSNLDKFVGVWTPSNSGGWIGNIKISIKDGKLFVQMKTDSGLKSFNDVKVSGDEISWSYVEEVNYGRYYIGMWTWASSGKREECIIIDLGNGRRSTNGAPTNIYQRGRTADREVEYWGFKGKLQEDVLNVSYKCWGNYYNGSDLVFDQSSGDTFYSSYTNW
jgi:hypothetical protein